VGIEVRHELKGVGENLRDHYSPRMKWTVPLSLGMTYNDKAPWPWPVLAGAEIRPHPQGLLGLPAAPIRAYVRTRAGLDAPDAAISWIPFLVGENFKLAKDSGVIAIMNILRSESTGSIHVSSRAPNVPPAVRFNFLSAQLDREVTLEAMRITRRIMTAPAMRGIATDEIAPGVNIQSDDELLDWVRNNAETTYHPVGTCKMGSDPMAVGRRPASCARYGRAARRRCVDHADADLGQHQCAVDHDRGEGIPDDPCGGSLIDRLSPAESSKIIPHQASGKTHAAR